MRRNGRLVRPSFLIAILIGLSAPLRAARRSSHPDASLGDVVRASELIAVVDNETRPIATADNGCEMHTWDLRVREVLYPNEGNRNNQATFQPGDPLSVVYNMTAYQACVFGPNGSTSITRYGSSLDPENLPARFVVFAIRRKGLWRLSIDRAVESTDKINEIRRLATPPPKLP